VKVLIVLKRPATLSTQTVAGRSVQHAVTMSLDLLLYALLTPILH
jgi:hypothetical protein